MSRFLRRRHGAPPCEKCGLETDVTNPVHEVDGALCTATQTQQRYFMRGWVQVISTTLLHVFEQAGVPVERAPGGYHLERHGTQPRMHYVTHEEAFAPSSAVAVWHALRVHKLADGFKLRALRALWSRPGIAEAIDSVWRMSGRASKVRAFIHRLTIDEENRREANPSA